MLDEEPDVELIVVVSKPPAAEVEAQLREVAAQLSTPVQFALLGPGQPDLTAAARAAAEALGEDWTAPRWWLAPQERRGDYRVLRGAFSGGTLCDEAMVLAAGELGPVASNIPLQGAPRVGPDEVRDGHAMIDFGDDDLTRGRPHPMIDGSLRAAWIDLQAQQAAADGTGLVLLLDVVLGHGAHPDPAAELGPVLRAAHETVQASAVGSGSGADLAVVISLCGSTGDPQGLERQAEALRSAGASVHLSNAHAARKALELLADDVRGAHR